MRYSPKDVQVELVLSIVELTDRVKAVVDNGLYVPAPMGLRKVYTCPSDNSFHSKHEVKKERADRVVSVHVLMGPLKGWAFEELKL